MIRILQSKGKLRLSEGFDTNKPLISLIAAISENGVIGNENKLLWNIPDDMKRFRRLTNGHPIIMGRKTFESIGHPLPNRTNIIVTHDNNYKIDGCTTTHSVEEAIEKAKETDSDEIFVIGGGQIYKQSIDFASKLHLTIIHKEFAGDTKFPDYSVFKKIVYKENHEENNLRFTFVDLVK